MTLSGTCQIEKPELISLAMENLGVAVTIIDTEGAILYYNVQAEKILDRKPEYIGKEVFLYHKNPASNDKIKSMLQAFKKGRTEPFYYEAKPYGEPVSVTVAPLVKNQKFIGCIQSIIPK